MRRRAWRLMRFVCVIIGGSLSVTGKPYFWLPVVPICVLQPKVSGNVNRSNLGMYVLDCIGREAASVSAHLSGLWDNRDVLLKRSPRELEGGHLAQAAPPVE